MASTSSSVMQSGFSTSTFRPAASASSTVRAWVAFGAAMTTASSPGWPIASSADATRTGMPNRSPTRSRTVRLGIGDHGELEPVAQKREVGQVHGLADQAGADHRDPAAVAGGAHDGTTLGQRRAAGLGRIRWRCRA